MSTPHDVQQAGVVHDSQARVAAASSVGAGRDDVVPYWLVALVAVLLVAVLGVGGYALVTLLDEREQGAVARGNDIAAWQQRVASNPGDIDTRLALGFAYQQAERYDEAVTTYGEVIAADAGNLGALYNRGMCLLETGDTSAAEESFAAVLDIAPQHALAAIALGEQYRVTGRQQLIASVVETAAAAHPEMADLRALMGVAYEKAGEADKAIAEYNEALRYAPGLPIAEEGLNRLGVSER